MATLWLSLSERLRMRSTIPALAVLMSAAALTLTGCGANSIDDIAEDTPRETRDEVYAAYLEDTYGDEYPNMDVAYGADVTLRLCSMLGSGEPVYPSDFDSLLEELPAEEVPVFKDALYQGVRVYCPEHLSQVEFFRPMGGGEG